MLQLIIGNRNYSSWSMRAWLLLKLASLEFEETIIQLGSADRHERLKKLGGQTAKVPVLIADGFAVWDSLAIAEYAHELSGRLWPGSSRMRARARSFAAEMHSGFPAIRSAMPCNIRARNRLPTSDPRLADEIVRIDEIWSQGCEAWLCDELSAADIFFAPVATRFRTYDIALSETALNYQWRLLSHPLIERWCALSLLEPEEPDYELPIRDIRRNDAF